MNNLPGNTLVVSVLAVFLLAACGQTSGTADTEDLRAEIESLENQIGRLEYRIFELERHINAENNAAIGQEAVEQKTIEPLPAPTAQGRYDLTPVE